MAQMVKAVRMILGMKTFGSASGWPFNQFAKNIEIEDDAPERKPSLEEIDALEVMILLYVLFVLILKCSQLLVDL